MYICSIFVYSPPPPSIMKSWIIHAYFKIILISTCILTLTIDKLFRKFQIKTDFQFLKNYIS